MPSRLTLLFYDDRYNASRDRSSLAIYRSLDDKAIPFVVGACERPVQGTVAGHLETRFGLIVALPTACDSSAPHVVQACLPDAAHVHVFGLPAEPYIQLGIL